MILGINNGGFFLEHDRYPNTNEELNDIKALGCNAIELRLYSDSKENIENMNLSGFEWRSIHISKWSILDIYSYDEELKNLNRLVEEKRIMNVVFHGGWLNSFDDMERYPNVIWSLENLGLKVGRHRTVEELAPIFEKYPKLKFTLDTRHALSVDRSGGVLNELWNSFKDNIAELHVSGGDDLVIPCYRERNSILEEFLHGKDNVPIIIESMFNTKDEIGVEVEYIKGLL